MLSYLLLAAAVSISAVSATPSPEPLREIGHVRATAACAELVLHANTAISSALRNDAVLGDTIQKLQNVHLDDNVITRRNSLQALGDYAKDLRARAVAGDREVKKLREIAEKSTDPVQKKELKAFADELGGALYRQKKIANDLNGLLAAYDYHDMKPTAAELNGNGMAADPQMLDYRIRQEPGQFFQPGRGGNPADKPHTDTELAQIAASDFLTRSADITNDEALAANHAEGAVSGC